MELLLLDEFSGRVNDAVCARERFPDPLNARLQNMRVKWEWKLEHVGKKMEKKKSKLRVKISMYDQTRTIIVYRSRNNRAGMLTYRRHRHS